MRPDDQANRHWPLRRYLPLGLGNIAGVAIAISKVSMERRLDGHKASWE